MMNAKDEKMLAIASRADLDTLFATIGHFDAQHQLGVAPKDKTSLIDRGKAWFDNHRKDIASAICQDQLLKDRILNPEPGESDKRDLILLVTDVLATVVSPIPIFYLAALVLKIGVRAICDDNSVR